MDTTPLQENTENGLSAIELQIEEQVASVVNKVAHIEQGGLFADTNFWVLLAFVIFVGFALKYGRDKILAIVDSHALNIKGKLDEAERLRTEAQSMLADYQRKHRDAMNEAEEIVSQAKKTADMIRKQAEENLAASLERREKQAVEKIQNAEQKALREVREKIVDVSMAATASIVQAHANSKLGEQMIDQSIDMIGKKAAR